MWRTALDCRVPAWSFVLLTTPFSLPHSLPLAEDAEGLAGLQVIHYDIKSSNILLDTLSKHVVRLQGMGVGLAQPLMYTLLQTAFEGVCHHALLLMAVLGSSGKMWTPKAWCNRLHDPAKVC